MKWTLYRLGLLGLFLYATLFVGSRSRPMDFAAYYHAAQRLLEGRDLYDTASDGVPYSYPPTAAWLCVPLTALPLRAAQWLWGVLQGMSLVLVVHFSVVLSRHAWEPLSLVQRRWLWLLAILMSARHLHSPLEYAQTDLMIVALCLGGIVSLLRQQARAWAGVPLAMAAGLKATPLLFAIFLARWRQWRTLAVMLGAAVLFTVMPSLQFPNPTAQLHLLQWMEVMVSPALRSGPAADRAGVWRADEEFNQALGGTLSRMFLKGCYSDKALLVKLDKGTVRTIFAALALGLLGGALFVRRGHWYGLRAPPLTPSGYEAAVVLVLMLLLSPKTSKAHFCALLLPILLVTATALRAPRAWPSLLWFFSGTAIGLLTKGIVGSKASSILLDYGYLTWFLFVVLAYLWFQRGPDEARPSAT